MAKVRVPTVPIRALSIPKLLRSVGGARLCYGEPVHVDGRTVIPVARVRAIGIGGFGHGGDQSDGGGGGGRLDAAPLGFIEVGPDGSRFQRIDDPDRFGRTLRAAAATLLGTAAGVRALRAGRRGPARLLPAPRRRG